MASKINIQIKRIYESPAEDDGYHMLVDRLWPRGIYKVEAKLQEWNKDIAPSVELRKWFDHKEERFDEFSKLYETELLEDPTKLERIKALAEKERVTMLFGAKDPKMNQAFVLCNVLRKIE